MLNFFPATLTSRAVFLTSAAAAGSVVIQLTICWVSLCGTSSVSIAALVTGFAVGGVLSDWFRQRIISDSSVGRSRNLLPVLTIAIVATAWLTPQLMNATLLAGCETVGSGGSLKSMLALLFPALIAAAGAGLAGAFFVVNNAECRVPWTVSAMAGTLAVPLAILQFQLTLPLAVSVTVAVSMTLLSRIGLASAEPQTSAGTTAIRPSSSPVFHSAATGILLLAVTEILSRFISLSLPLLLLASLLTATGLAILSTQRLVRLLTAEGLTALSLLLIAGLPLLFERLADQNLQWQASSGVPILIVLRALQLAAFCSAACLPLVLASKSGQNAIQVRMILLPLAIGLVTAIILISRGWSPSIVLAGGILVHAIGGYLSSTSRQKWSEERMGQRPAFPRRAVLASVAALSGLVLAVIPRWNVAEVSGLVFSPRARIALERGLEKELIPQSDANRLVETVRSSSGDLAVWRRSGSIFEFQRNGMSLGRVSADTSLSPQPPEEVLPAIMGLVSHPLPSRVLLLGDETGAALRTCTHFPVQEIVAVRSDEMITKLASRFTWSSQTTPADQDSRVTILHEPQPLTLRNRQLKNFDVVIASGESASESASSFQYTQEFYQTVRSRMTANGIFCQRFPLFHLGPEPVKQTMSTLMTQFEHVGVVQTIPGELLIFATNDSRGIVDPQILTRLQKDHVRREIASAGWDWSQVAILPLLDAKDPVGLFSHEKRPRALSISNGGLVLTGPCDGMQKSSRLMELNAAFGPHQMQFLAAIPVSEDHEEVKRRLSALSQQLEILAGMPDQPWTYRKSLRMEMQRTPRPPVEVVRNGEIVKTSHPLDVLRKDYFLSLGKALQAVSQSSETVPSAIDRMQFFTACGEPLISFFANYEIVRLYELAHHPDSRDELRHRLQIVFQTNPSDASVRPVVSAIDQLVRDPSLIAEDAERYDILNSLVQKLIERWEARTAWEPRSAQRVQNDVDQSVRVANRAMELMESILPQAGVKSDEFRRRRRFVHAALIAPLRDYRDQVLAHRMKTEQPAEPDTEDPNDMPLLLTPPQNTHAGGGLTN